jgi:predicted unusual protein kinase regulating ubiquinone biosynthesis (AarF/ABC1/UbiB family)
VPSELPTGRLTRLAKMAKAGAAAGAGAALGRSSETTLRYAADALCELRGLPAKAGQMTGYVDGFAPATHRVAFRSAMHKLLTETSASPPARVKRLVEAELGRRLGEAFAEWEEAPFASASIGQVHRARLHDGRAVAVKVQHPGIQAALEGDIGNARMIEAAVQRLAPAGIDVGELLREAAARFREELDYEREGRNIAEFHRLHAGDPSMQLPRFIASHSSRRVLTTLYCGGETFEQACRHAAGFREHYAETLWRFVTRSILHGGMFNADPHPGNYLFNKDGKVVFLDFGCVQRLSHERRQQAIALRLSAVQRDEAAFQRAVRDWFSLRAGRHEAPAQRFMRLCFEPIFASPFRFTPEFAARVVGGIQEFKGVVFTREPSGVRFPVETVLLNRLQFGFYSVLARLDVEIDYAVLDGEVILEGQPAA